MISLRIRFSQFSLTSRLTLEVPQAEGRLITENVSLRFHPEKRCECRTLSGIYMYMV